MTGPSNPCREVRRGSFTLNVLRLHHDGIGSSDSWLVLLGSIRPVILRHRSQVPQYKNSHRHWAYSESAQCLDWPKKYSRSRNMVCNFVSPGKWNLGFDGVRFALHMSCTASYIIPSIHTTCDSGNLASAGTQTNSEYLLKIVGRTKFQWDPETKAASGRFFPTCLWLLFLHFRLCPWSTTNSKSGCHHRWQFKFVRCQVYTHAYLLHHLCMHSAKTNESNKFQKRTREPLQASGEGEIGESSQSNSHSVVQPTKKKKRTFILPTWSNITGGRIDGWSPMMEIPLDIGDKVRYAITMARIAILMLTPAQIVKGFRECNFSGIRYTVLKTVP